MSEVDTTFIGEMGVRADWIDLRDQDYVPNLAILKRALPLDPNLLTQLDRAGLRHPAFSVRNQGNTGRCVGYALANLIDIQRHLQHANGGTPQRRDFPAEPHPRPYR